MAMGAALGSLLPDLDASESKIKYLSFGTFKPFSLPAHIAYRTAGHRGVLHSLIGLADLSLKAWTGKAKGLI